jgi:hypothetical protein
VKGRLSQTVILQHNNAWPHTASKTLETIQDLKFELLEHPPYSPDVTPSNFLMFGPLEDAIGGVRFSDYEEVKNAVHSWLCTQPRNFFFSGITNVGPSAWNGGDYVEKWCTLYFYVTFFIYEF